MNRVVIRRIVIGLCFIISLVFFSVFMNQGNTDMTAEMKAASLPTASIVLGGQDMNLMHGYTKKMNEAGMRDSLTPIGEDRSITFRINKFEEKISEVSYEVRSADGERLIEDGTIASYDETKDFIKATIALKDLIDPGEEYTFILIPRLEDGRNVYFYTRIIQCDNTYTADKIQFVKDFHEKTFDKVEAQSIAKYLEPNSSGDNTNFGNVNIHCSYNQICWGDMHVKEQGAPKFTICELGEQTAGIIVDSIVKVREEAVENTYRVKEYYRIRFTPERVYLLNFERTMEEIFTMEKQSFANNKIVLGIQKDDVSMEESDGGNILAFVNAGRIYSYNVSENKFARLFAFMDDENFDDRTTYDKSNVKILDVEENGNVTFAVYGYMNRGSHEGEVGVEICYYNSVVNTIEEQIFIQYDKSPMILLSEVENFFYMNNSNKLYTMLDGTLYEVDLSMKKYEVMVTDLSEDTVCVSESNRMIVWIENGEAYGGKKLILFDCVKETESDISAGNSEYIKPIGFMNEDLIYGIAKTDDVTKDFIGNTVFPMKRLIIRALNGDILKKYNEEGIYITEGLINDNQLTLKRVEKTGESAAFKEIADDQITSNTEVEVGTNKATLVATDLFEKIWQIELKKEIETKGMKFHTPQEVLFEGGRTLALETEEMPERFYIYAKGEALGSFKEEGNAVKLAYENVGTVMDSYGKEIYKRGEVKTLNQIMAIKEERVSSEKNSMVVCLDTILKLEGLELNTANMLERGESAEKILARNLKDCKILNLHGCPMDVMLYYVNQDYPVLAALENGTAVMIIGFNQQNVVIFDPLTGSISKKGMNDSREMFEKNGNHFLTYMKQSE